MDEDLTPPPIPQQKKKRTKAAAVVHKMTDWQLLELPLFIYRTNIFPSHAEADKTATSTLTGEIQAKEALPQPP